MRHERDSKISRLYPALPIQRSRVPQGVILSCWPVYRIEHWFLVMPSIRLPLYYRLLFPELIEAKNRQGALEAPPRITQSSSIDQELYIYQALIIRDFILPWYQTITLDYGLSKEVTRIVSVCAREVEARCQKVEIKKLGTSYYPTNYWI